MKKEEIYKELEMTHDELLKYLLEKYGGAISDYFATKECRSKSKKISRTGEGLYCHHMDEDKGCNLSDRFSALQWPFEYQKKERLVYCNVMEHLILHIKIAVLRQKRLFKKPYDISTFFSTGGIFMLCKEINDMFLNNGTSLAWKRSCFEKIKDNYTDYIILLKAILKYISTNYCGNKNESSFLVAGAIVDHRKYGKCKIESVSKGKNQIVLKLPTCEEKTENLREIMNAFINTSYKEQMDIITARMSEDYAGEFHDKIYDDIINCTNESEIDICLNLFKVDYKGYGFAQYADIKLTEDYGTDNADKYISKALPMYCENTSDLKGKKVKFWKGSKMPLGISDKFYVVRIESKFNIKEGEEPFIRYRERDYLRRPIFDQKNFNFKDIAWTILSTSEFFSRESQKYIDDKVVLTLGKEDYLLFKERYNIRYLKILDGCYFY